MHRTPDVRLLLILILGLFASGCVGRLHSDKLLALDDPEKCAASDASDGARDCALAGKYILIHADGYALTPHDRRATREEFKSQLARIVAGLRHHAASLTGKGCQNTLKILLFVHGGLNGHDSSVERMTEWTETGNFLPNSCYYPIFIAWDSAIGSSLLDDLFGIRFGQRTDHGIDRVYSVITAPIVAVSRLLSAMTSLPLAMGHSVYNFAESIQAARHESGTDGQQGDPWWLLDAGVYTALVPLQLVTTPLLEGLGTPAWQMMKRRADLAVAARLPCPTVSIFTFKRKQCDDPLYPREGAAWTLVTTLKETVDELRKARAQDATRPDVSITLVGHSMGAMLLNRMVAIAADTLPFRSVVYLAPAASIDDVTHTVLTYLHRQEHRRCANEWQVAQLESLAKLAAPADEARNLLAQARARLALDTVDTRFWIFTLNARDEAREVARDYAWFLWTVPRGSLLQWIDGYFEPNTTRGQTTSGKKQNIEPYSQELGKDTILGIEITCDEGYSTWQLVTKQKPKDTEDNGTGIPDFERRLDIPIPGVQDGRVQIYHALRSSDRLFTPEHRNAPAEHGDFTEPRFVAQVLCRVDGQAFRHDYCRTSVPNLKPPLKAAPTTKP